MTNLELKFEIILVSFVSPGDPKGQQAARHLRRGRAGLSAPQVRLPVPRQPVRIPVFIQRHHHTAPGETPCPLSVCLPPFYLSNVSSVPPAPPGPVQRPRPQQGGAKRRILLDHHRGGSGGIHL